ncbi:V-type ATPase subunit [Salmonella enterica]|nr:V-type ATPase subunit [Salmonella enterica]
MKKPKRKIIYFIIFFLLCSIGYYLYQQQHKMYVLDATDDIESVYWPNEKVWFDAGEWLKKTQYERINGKFLLNIKYIPIEDFDGIMRSLWEKRTDWGSITDLQPLKKMTLKDFEEVIKDKLTSEYLYTRFDNSSLLPDNDYFLVYFSYKDKKYEFEVIRTPFQYENKETWRFYLFDVERAGYWYSKKSSSYSYRDYMNGKRIPTCWSCYLSFSPQLERLIAESVW